MEKNPLVLKSDIENFFKGLKCAKLIKTRGTKKAFGPVSLIACILTLFNVVAPILIIIFLKDYGFAMSVFFLFIIGTITMWTILHFSVKHKKFYEYVYFIEENDKKYMFFVQNRKHYEFYNYNNYLVVHKNKVFVHGGNYFSNHYGEDKRFLFEAFKDIKEVIANNKGYIAKAKDDKSTIVDRLDDIVSNKLTNESFSGSGFVQFDFNLKPLFCNSYHTSKEANQYTISNNVNSVDKSALFTQTFISYNDENMIVEIPRELVEICKKVKIEVPLLKQVKYV